MKQVIGVDIGGTTIQAGNVLHGDVLNEKSKNVNNNDTENKIMQNLIAIIDEIYSDNVTAIGIGVPAVVDSNLGIVYDVQNLPSWKKVHLKKIISSHFKVPVFINNDANCFIVGERAFGEAKGFDNVIGLCIGTGLGMGVIINGQLYNGVLCGAGEIGMLSYKDSILENYTSSFFFTNNYEKSASELAVLAKKGDTEALEAFSVFGKHLGEAIKNILYMYAPEAIIMGGSISKAYPYFKEAMEECIQTFAYPKQIENLKLKVSNQSSSAILGAAALCF